MSAALSVLLASSVTVPAFGQEVGVLAAVNRDMTGERPAETKRQIFLQDKLVSNETIETSAEGGGQVLFLDQTSLTITKNSTIVLDKYVYDPDADAGEMGISVLKGAMRIVGGRITKKQPALIRTPSATIGIRGGIGNVTVRPDGSTVYMHVAGVASTIEVPGQPTLTITREGGLAVAQQGAPAQYAGVADPATVQAVYGAGSTGEGDGQSSQGDTSSGGGDGQSGSGDQQQQQQQQQQRSAATDNGTRQVANENSGQPGSEQQGPISTDGERQQTDPDIDFGNDGDEEVADNNADEIAGTIDQNIDQLFFNGIYNPTLIGGDGAGSFSGLTFQMVYSIRDQEGLVVIELPEAVNAGGFGSENLQGQAIFGDAFVVGGASLQALTAANDPETLLGGNASGVSLAISPNIVVSGDLGIDYSGSAAVTVDNLTAAIGGITGNAVDDVAGAVAADLVDDFRAVINENTR